MNMETLDATGMACPLPVIKTKKLLAEHDVVETIVDNEIATQNLKKLADQLGYGYQCTKESVKKYIVVISKDASQEGAIEQEAFQEQPLVPASNEYVVVIDTNVMGRGSDELGRTLIKAFIYSLTEQDILPQKVICYNGGVHFTCEGSDVLEDLQTLADKGVEIYSCGACLNFYELTEKLAIGEVTNMYSIVEMIRSANKIVKP